MKPVSSSPYSQVPAICPYREPNPTSLHPSHFPKIHLNIILPSSLGLPNVLFPSGFPTRTLCTTLPSPIRATCPAHLIPLHFTTRTILGEENKSFSSSLYNLLHSPVTSSLLGPNFPSTPCSQTPSASFPPAVSTTKFHTHTKQQAILQFYIS